MVVAIFNNPNVAGHLLVRQELVVVQALRAEIKKIRTIFEDAVFLWHHKDAIPCEAQHQVIMSDREHLDLKIKAIDSTSERICLRGLKFKSLVLGNRLFSVICTQDEQAITGTTPSRILARAFFVSAARLTGEVALAILCFPIAVVGGAVKAISFATHSLNRPTLHVEVVESREWASLGKVARAWQKLASEKQKLRDSEVLFQSDARIAKLVAECMESPRECSFIFDRALVCRDTQSRIQAIALTHNYEAISDHGTFLKIAHLVTHPHNIRSKANECEFDRVEGAGSALVRYIARESLSRQLAGVYAEVTTSAKKFYEKLGFEAVQRDISEMVEPLETPMILKGAKIS
jgi:hypothetical protein